MRLSTDCATFVLMTAFAALQPSNIEAFEERLRISTSSDPDGVNFSLRAGVECAIDLVEVRVDAPATLDLGNDDVATSLVDRGIVSALTKCRLDTSKWLPQIRIFVYQPTFGNKYVVSGGVGRGTRGVYRVISGRDVHIRTDEFRAAEMLGLAPKIVISRTIEGFTLGIHFEDAIEKIMTAMVQGRISWKEGRPSKELLTTSFSQKMWSPPGADPLFAPQVAIAVSPNLSSDTAAHINLMFFEGKLFEVYVRPVAPSDSVLSAMRDRYGPPLRRQDRFYEWFDPRTVVIFDPSGMGPYGLEYRDRELLDLMKRRIAEIQRVRKEKEEEEERRRRGVLPRGY